MSTSFMAPHGRVRLLCAGIALAAAAGTSIAATTGEEAAVMRVQEPLTVTFAPSAGSQVKKSWTASHTLTLHQLSTQLGDEPPASPELRGRLESSQVVVVSDTYLASEGGRPTQLERRFDKLSSSGSLSLQGDLELEREAELTSDLSGLSVRYTWVPEEASYGKYYSAKDGDESDLEPLGEDLDLRCVLPAGPVAVGATWEVDPQHLTNLLSPCGELQLRPTDSGDKSLGRSLRYGMGGGLENAFGGRSQADFDVVFKELREVDGQSMAVLALVFRGRFLQEKTTFLGEDVLRREALRGAQYDRSQIVLNLDGKGEVLWNLELGRAHSMQLTASEDTTLKIIEKYGEEELDLIQTLSMRGVVRVGLEVEPVAEAD